MRQYYIYVLFDWLGTPRYVGKGSGYRWLDHKQSTKVSHRNQQLNDFLEQNMVCTRRNP